MLAVKMYRDFGLPEQFALAGTTLPPSARALLRNAAGINRAGSPKKSFRRARKGVVEGLRNKRDRFRRCVYCHVLMFLHPVWGGVLGVNSLLCTVSPGASNDVELRTHTHIHMYNTPLRTF